MLFAGYLSWLIFACTMGGQEQPPEKWASRPDVEQLLAYRPSSTGTRRASVLPVGVPLALVAEAASLDPELRAELLWHSQDCWVEGADIDVFEIRERRLIEGLP